MKTGLSPAPTVRPIGLIDFAVVYAVAVASFGMRMSGSGRGFVAVLVAFSLLTSSFGLTVAALGRMPEATRGRPSWSRYRR